MAMRKTKTRSTRSAEAPPPARALRAWHVVQANGGDATITAEISDVYDGALLFFNQLEDDLGGRLIVRGFASGAWLDVSLVDTDAFALDTNATT